MTNATGLSEAEASRRLAAHGPNEPVRVHRLSGIVQFVHLFANPIIIILLVASAVSASLGQRTDAIIIATMILLNNFLYDVAQIAIPSDNVDRFGADAAAALGHRPGSRLHARRRPGQLAIRFPDVLRAASGAARRRGTVPHRVVRRIAGDADARPVR